MLSENERLNIYFDDAMEEIDCQKVLSLWKNEPKLTDISQKLKHVREIVTKQWVARDASAKQG
jgi:hypothetical protein